MSRVPKLRWVGIRTVGPPISAHRRRNVFCESSTVAVIWTRPLALDSAPYLTALVHSSFKTMARGSTAPELTSIFELCTKNRPAPLVSKGSMAVFNIFSSDVLPQLVCNNKSCTRPSAMSRWLIASLPCSRLSAARRLCEVIAITMAKVFFTRWCNSSSRTRCNRSTTLCSAASIPACARRRRRSKFSTSSRSSSSVVTSPWPSIDLALRFPRSFRNIATLLSNGGGSPRDVSAGDRHIRPRPERTVDRAARPQVRRPAISPRGRGMPDRVPGLA